jgi:hypothetical protein
MSKKYKPGQYKCLDFRIEHQKRVEKRIMEDLNLFDIQYSSLFRWPGKGSPDDSRSPHIWTSFCHLIIAQELATDTPWVILVDQDQATGTSITNSVQWLIPRVCRKFDLDIFNVRAFEIYPQNSFFTEIVIQKIFPEEPVARIEATWKPCNEAVIGSLKKVMLVAGEGIIDSSKMIVVGPR